MRIHIGALLRGAVGLLFSGVLISAMAEGEDLNVPSGHINLDTGYSIKIGGQMALTLGGLSNRSVLAGPNTGVSDYTVAIGYSAMYGNTGVSNVAIGAKAMHNSTGSANAAFGASALFENTGSQCLGMGANALYRNSGWSCVGVGSDALYLNAATGCVAIGFQALRGNAAGAYYSTAIGYQAGLNNTKQSCVLIGYQAAATDHHQMVIGSDNWRGTIRNVYIGKGVWAAAPEDVTIQATSSTGTAKGADLILAGGASTGGTPGRVIAARELSTPVLEITGGSDLAETFPVRKAAQEQKSKMMELLLKHGARK